MDTWKVMARYHYYEVYKGRRPSIYNLWNKFKEQVNGYPNALYKGFTNPHDAMDGLSSYQLEVGIRTQPTRAAEKTVVQTQDVAVDLADNRIRLLVGLLVAIFIMWAGAIYLVLHVCSRFIMKTCRLVHNSMSIDSCCVKKYLALLEVLIVKFISRMVHSGNMVLTMVD